MHLFRALSKSNIFEGLVLGVGLAGSIGTMIGTIRTSPENTMQKHLFWLVRAFSFARHYLAKIVSGIQRMSGCSAQPDVLLRTRCPLSCCVVYLRDRRLSIMGRRNGQVSIL